MGDGGLATASHVTPAGCAPSVMTQHDRVARFATLVVGTQAAAKERANAEHIQEV